jgi:hypothetical protein
MNSRRTPCALTLLSILLTPFAAAEGPQPVSPGDASHMAVASVSCPTFLWTAAGGDAVNLVVYRLPSEPSESEPTPAIEIILPGSAQGWTPSLGDCLEAGAQYAWSVRSTGEASESEWSEVALFEVAALPSSAEIERVLSALQRSSRTNSSSAISDSSNPQRSASPATRGQKTSGALAGDPSPAALVAPEKTAISGAPNDTTGVVVAVQGLSASSTDGSAGLLGRSTATSGDTLGVGGEVASVGGAAGVFDNTAGGDILRGFSNGTRVLTVDGNGVVGATGFAGDGSGLSGVTADDADTVDGQDASSFAAAAHVHSGDDITSGMVTEPRIDALLARDTEIFPAVLAADGSGSLLDADLLDGMEASALMASAGRYYLSTATMNGAAATSACATGFHMASIWEILDPSSLAYDASLGIDPYDGGGGPPRGYKGWVRTGGLHLATAGAGAENCELWTSDDSGVNGTDALLPNLWTHPTSTVYPIAPWSANATPCDTSQEVWCVED